MEVVSVKIENTKKLYDKIVEENLRKISEGKIDDIQDPDIKTKYSIKIDGVDILLAQDGLCSIKKIKEFCDGNIVKDYKMIRENMFNVLYWPAYAMSINMMRSSKYKDRVDLLLNDIYAFYEIVDEKTELTTEVVKNVWEKCDLARAYIFPNTFYWLRSFENFDNFVKNEQRNLSCFVPEPIGQPWNNTGNGFTQEYYNELLNRIQQYKKSIADIAIAEGNSCEELS